MSSVAKRAVLLFVSIFLLSLVGFLLVVFSFRPDVDPEKVDPKVREIEAPLRNVALAWYTDGGSKAIGMEDASGTTFLFMLPHPMMQPKYYDKLFDGHYEDGREIDEVEFPDTRTALLNLIEGSGSRSAYAAGILWKLNDNWIVKCRIFLRHHTGYYDERP